MLIESEGLLYRGPDLCSPEEIWNYRAKTWVKYWGGRLRPEEAVQVDEARAETLKYNSSVGEHFLWYDIPPWLQPLSDEYRKAMMSPAVLEAIEHRKARRAAPQAAQSSD